MYARRSVSIERDNSTGSDHVARPLAARKTPRGHDETWRRLCPRQQSDVRDAITGRAKRGFASAIVRAVARTRADAGNAPRSAKKSRIGRRVAVGGVASPRVSVYRDNVSHTYPPWYHSLHMSHCIINCSGSYGRPHKQYVTGSSIF